MIVYQDDENFQFCTSVPEIRSVKHHKIQEFPKIYHNSAMKTKKCLFFNTSTGLLHLDEQKIKSITRSIHVFT
jgi:hypothetical protein